MSKVAQVGDRRSNRPLPAASILDNDSVGGLLADIVNPVGYGGSRAGRAAIMARAAGKEAPFEVRHPSKSSILYTLLGGGLGGLVGAGLGGAGGLAIGGLGGGVGGAAAGGVGGAAAGGVAGLLGGSIAGLLAALIRRRKSYQQISTDYDEARVKNKLKKDVKPTHYSALHKLIAPLSGAYRFGEAQAVKGLRGEKQPYTPLQHAANISGFVPYVSAARIPLGWAQHASATNTLRELDGGPT